MTKLKDACQDGRLLWGWGWGKRHWWREVDRSRGISAGTLCSTVIISKIYKAHIKLKNKNLKTTRNPHNKNWKKRWTDTSLKEDIHCFHFMQVVIEVQARAVRQEKKKGSILEEVVKLFWFTVDMTVYIDMVTIHKVFGNKVFKTMKIC